MLAIDERWISHQLLLRSASPRRAPASWQVDHNGNLARCARIPVNDLKDAHLAFANPGWSLVIQIRIWQQIGPPYQVVLPAKDEKRPSGLNVGKVAR